MIEFQSKTFNDDITINDDVHFTGSSTALGNMLAFSIISDKELNIAKNLTSTQGSVIARSSLIVGNDLISTKDIVVKGQCVVNNNIIGKRLSFFGPSLKAKSIRAKSIKVRGNVSIHNDVTASETLDIELNPRRFKVNILGLIYSPKVNISFRGSFSKWFILSHTILKKFGKKTRRKRNFTIENLNIEAKELIILTYYPPEKVNVEYINSNINVLNIEIKQLI